MSKKTCSNSRDASKVGAGVAHQRGQAYTEYILVLFCVVLTLLADIPKPVESVKCPNNKDQCSALEMLMETIRQNYSGYAYAITTPEHPDPVLDPDALLDELFGD